MKKHHEEIIGWLAIGLFMIAAAMCVYCEHHGCNVDGFLSKI
jgi:hypothetical protein